MKRTAFKTKTINILYIVFVLSILPLTTHAISFPTKIDTLQERKNVQTVLNSVMIPSPNLKVDGVLGKKSIQTIQAFQDSHGLVADGKVGPITRKAFEDAQTDKSTANITAIISSVNNTVPTGCVGNNKYSNITGVLCAVSTPIISTIKPIIHSESTSSSNDGIPTSTSTSNSTSAPTTPAPASCSGSTTQSCTIINGMGTQSRTCNSGTWSTYGSCILNSCNTGYQINNNNCTLIISTPANPTKIIGVTASGSQDANYLPEKTLDGILSDTSYWAVEGDGQYITYELSQTTSVSYVRLAFYYSSQRYFDIQYSTNNSTWTNANPSRLTSAANMANQFQTFSFTPVTARYIRILGHGSSLSLWNAITETDINGFAINLPVAPVVPITPPVCVPETSATTCLNKCGTQTNNCGSSVSCTACAPANNDKVVVYYNNFEQNSTGVYTSGEKYTDWNASQSNTGEDIFKDTNDIDDSTKVYRFFFPKGTNSLNDLPSAGRSDGFSMWKYFSQGYNELYLTYKVKFSDAFDPVLGGKLPRLQAGYSGAGAGYCPNGTDWFTGGMMFEPSTGFGKMIPSFYLYYVDMWKSPSYYWDMFVSQFGRNPTNCQDEVNAFGGVYGDGYYWNYTMNGNKWYTLTERIVANTPGSNNGIVEAYVDGNMVFKKGDFNFRTTTNLQLDRIQFVSFFGGSGPQYASTKDQYIYFDDVMAYYYNSSSGQITGNNVSPSSRVLPAMSYPASSILN